MIEQSTLTRIPSTVNISAIDPIINTNVKSGLNTSNIPNKPRRGAKYAYDTQKAQKPKRNKSAFLIYSLDARTQLKMSGITHLNANEMMVKVADLWRNLAEEQKEPYYKEASIDKARYHQELRIFWEKYPLEALENKTKKNHIKKPTTAYGLFLKDVKDDIRKEHPELKMAAVLKIIAQRWKNLDNVRKAFYTERAKTEQAISRQELEKYCLKGKTHPEDLLKRTKMRQRNFLRKQGRQRSEHDEAEPELDDSDRDQAKIEETLSQDSINVKIKYEEEFGEDNSQYTNKLASSEGSQYAVYHPLAEYAMEYSEVKILYEEANCVPKIES